MDLLPRIGIAISCCILTAQILAEQCLTPNNETAACISLYTCPILISALASQHPVSIEFVRKSSCGGTAENPLACCGSASNFTTETNSTKSENVSKLSLLPTRSYCGLQHADDYLRRKNDTAIRITEFPWSARIKFKTSHSHIVLKNEYFCVGSLINRRYVLSAAHCFIRTGYIPVSVQLGEYNVKNTTDCVQEPPFEEECSEPLQEIAVENVIPHPKYKSRKQFHDIALIRLAEGLIYSDYIRPICLSLPGRPTPQIGDTLLSTGWGKKSNQEDYVEIKKKIYSTLITSDDCHKLFQPIKVHLIQYQFCVTAFKNNTNFECVGDSGGPLMFSHINQWYQVGVVSYGVACASVVPYVYTNVTKYLDWILDVIEP